MDILMVIVCKFVSSNVALSNFLPYVEGILIDTPEAIEDVVDLSEEPGKDLISTLTRIIHMTDNIYSAFIQDISVRILTRIYSK